MPVWMPRWKGSRGGLGVGAVEAEDALRYLVEVRSLPSAAVGADVVFLRVDKTAYVTWFPIEGYYGQCANSREGPHPAARAGRPGRPARRRQEIAGGSGTVGTIASDAGGASGRTSIEGLRPGKEPRFLCRPSSAPDPEIVTCHVPFAGDSPRARVRRECKGRRWHASIEKEEYGLYEPDRETALNWLVTGGCGFLGTSLIRSLLDEGGHGVRVVDNLTVGDRDDLATAADFVEKDSEAPRPIDSDGPLARGGRHYDEDMALRAAEGADV